MRDDRPDPDVERELWRQMDEEDYDRRAFVLDEDMPAAEWLNLRRRYAEYESAH